jgi:hypothetical protein
LPDRARRRRPGADDGTPATAEGNVVDCGVRPGYLHSAYERILPVCEQAQRWETDVHLA